MESGAARVWACAVHGLFSGPAIQRIEQSAIERFLVTNTIPLPPEKAACKKLVTLSVVAVSLKKKRSIHEETSVSSLFV